MMSVGATNRLLDPLDRFGGACELRRQGSDSQDVARPVLQFRIALAPLASGKSQLSNRLEISLRGVLGQSLGKRQQLVDRVAKRDLQGTRSAALHGGVGHVSPDFITEMTSSGRPTEGALATRRRTSA